MTKRADASENRRALSRSRVDFVTTRAGVLGAILLFVTLWFERDAMAGASAQAILVVVGLAIGFASVLTAIVVSGVVLPGLARQTEDLAQVFRSVAQGDLTREPSGGGEEFDGDPLRSATRGALTSLKSSVGEIREAARDVSTRVQNVSAQCGVASSVAQRSTESASTMSHQGATVSELAHSAHGEVRRIIGGMQQVAEEIRQQRARDTRIRELSQDTLIRVRTGTGALDTLSSAVEASAGELQALAGASEEIRSFVTLVRKMARQSKLLALNAAMEAARAGEQGSGFGVVASEVRRLARSSSEAADRTDQLVSDVLERLERVRAATVEAVDAVSVVRDTTTAGLSTLEQLGQAAGEAVESGLAEEQRVGGAGAAAEAFVLRIERLAQEADALARAVSETATVTSAQQSRLQEIAVAVTAVARAASRVLTAAGGLRIDQRDFLAATPDPVPEPAPTPLPVADSAAA